MTVLLSVLLVPFDNAEARLKYYRYNDNIPMVEMSLNMMVAMGVLEPIPSRLVHDGNPYNRLATSRYDRYSRYSGIYPRRARYSGRSRYYDDYWDEPSAPYRSRYYRSRYGYGADPWYLGGGDYWDSPWSDRWRSPWYADWDSPVYSSWGSPWDSGLYSRWSSPWDSGLYSRWSGPWDSGLYNRWDSPRYSSWSNPWDSLRGYQLLNPWSSPFGYLGSWPYTSGYPGYLLTPDTLLGDTWPGSEPDQSKAPAPNPNHGNKSSKNGFDKVRFSRSARPARTGYGRGHQRADRNTGYQRLNGLWVGDTGEMLGIRGDDFLWYDKGSKYAKGQLIKSPTTMQARIPETRTVVRFHYRLQGDELVILSRDGKTRIFNRMPLIQAQRASTGPHAAHTSYHPDSEYLHVARSSYQSGAVAPGPAESRPASAAFNTAGQTRWKRDASGSYAGNSNRGPGVRGARITFSRDHAATTDPLRSNPSTARTNGVMPAPKHLARDAAAVLRATYTRDAGSGHGSQAVRAEEADKDPVESITDDVAEGHGAPPSGADGNDPYTYLFSYLKDTDRPDAGAEADNSADTGVAVTPDRTPSNIWRPNDLFPDRRRSTSATVSLYSGEDSANAAEGQASVSGTSTFRWPETGVWE